MPLLTRPQRSTSFLYEAASGQGTGQEPHTAHGATHCVSMELGCCCSSSLGHWEDRALLQRVLPRGWGVWSL